MMGSEGGLPLWQIYAAIDDPNRIIIQKWVSTMVEGMAQLDDPASPPRIVNRN